MSSWFILVVLILLVMFFLRMKNMKHRFYLIFIVLILVFTYTSVSSTVRNNHLDVTTLSGMVTAGKVYFNWLGQLFENTKNLVGDAVKMEWVGNSSNLK